MFSADKVNIYSPSEHPSSLTIDGMQQVCDEYVATIGRSDLSADGRNEAARQYSLAIQEHPTACRGLAAVLRQRTTDILLDDTPKEELPYDERAMQLTAAANTFRFVAQPEDRQELAKLATGFLGDTITR